MKNMESRDQPSPRVKFGTFGGVFTPCTLTIPGVIMFLRFGQVVGQAGILQAMVIILCAKLITTLTAFSTNDPLWEIVKQTGDSALLFADFTPPEEGRETEFTASTASLMQIPLDVILVYNSGDVSLEA